MLILGMCPNGGVAQNARHNCAAASFTASPNRVISEGCRRLAEQDYLGPGGMMECAGIRVNI